LGGDGADGVNVSEGIDTWIMDAVGAEPDVMAVCTCVGRGKAFSWGKVVSFVYDEGGLDDGHTRVSDLCCEVELGVRVLWTCGAVVDFEVYGEFIVCGIVGWDGVNPWDEYCGREIAVESLDGGIE